MALVLCAGEQPTLVETRKMILERAGHRVTGAVGFDQIAAACRQDRYDVVVIGHFLAAKQKARVFALVRERCPSAKVLELYRTFSTKILPEADDWLEVPIDVPPELAERVTRLAEK